jgi:AbrB family looped-hinge helix DNA binding protein
MITKVILDKAGRMVIPKHVRERLRLGPGDALALKIDGECITLLPVHPRAVLKQESGVWFYQGEAADTSADLIERKREKRAGGLRR